MRRTLLRPGGPTRPSSARRLWGLTLALAAGCVETQTRNGPAGSPAALRTPSAERYTSRTPVRGVALLHVPGPDGDAGYGTAASARSLHRAAEAGVNFVSLRVPGRQAHVRSPKIRYGPDLEKGETDGAVVRTIEQAHARGLKVMLKPHIMLDRITDTEWRARIDFEDPDLLNRWWNQYRQFVLHHAELASEHDVELFAVGVELMDMVIRAPDRWRALIRDVRSKYTGGLTYAANWDREFQLVPFWEDLDLVAVQFFHPLSKHPEPSDSDLMQRLGEISDHLFEVARDHRRPLLLTECGYRSVRGATVRPWVWPKDDPGALPAPELQARVYRAVLNTFEPNEDFAGLFWWNWLTLPDPGTAAARLFTPQGKPAERVLKKRWTEAGPAVDSTEPVRHPSPKTLP
ncbi:MAG TPA: hypothetical protein RMG48_16115 [Myxococcales bacterium LLY-WYZ-16_1]|nr:hypothetical protein [Myxococcales bacterium LLY-WYZ-16_1]